MAAGEPAMKPNASPGTALNAMESAPPALAEKANSKWPDSLIYNSPAYLLVSSSASEIAWRTSETSFPPITI